MNELLRLLRDAADALSAGADPADVDAMIRSRTDGRASNYDVLNRAVAKLQQAQGGRLGAKPEAAGLGLASRATFGFFDELAGLARAAQGGGSLEERAQRYRDAVQKARLVQSALAEQEQGADAVGGLASALVPGSAMRLGRIGGMTVPGKWPTQPGDIIRVLAAAGKPGLAHAGAEDPSVDRDVERNTIDRLRAGTEGGMKGLLSLMSVSLTEPPVGGHDPARSLFDAID